MTLYYIQRMGKPYPLGVSKTKKGINIAISIKARNECGIILYYKNKNSQKIPFDKSLKIGNLYTIHLENVDIKNCSYQFYGDEKIMADPYAKRVTGREKWGVYNKDKTALSYQVLTEEFDWEEDRPLAIPYHESIFYGIHVRGFTKHSSSKVKGKGTFSGIVEKIPYFKELGITSLMVMPMYDFNEVIQNVSFQPFDKTIAPFMDEKKQTWEYKINYWGFAEEAQYFAPKASFSYGKDSIYECKEMIKQLHKNGIEVIMQLYFPKETKDSFIYEVLKYWMIEYHVDGFFLMGSDMPMTLLGTDPLFGTTKIIGECFNAEQIYAKQEQPQWFKNMAVFQDDFMCDSRKFLKGDAGMLSVMAEHFRYNPREMSKINYITNYQSFTLMDLVSYNVKHNDDNGEDNKDGSNYNYSWNCGTEGKTRKKTVVNLRLKQIKNALLMLFLAQGPPLLMSGDEFGNSANGNNNPYCQDNSVTWLNWTQIERHQEIHLLVKTLISIRKKHPILHKEEALKLMDYIACGYPDLSYHGELTWNPMLESNQHHMGILYCGKYVKVNKKKADDFFYIAYNLHWKEHEFALPKLPEGMKWNILLNTADDMVSQGNIPAAMQNKIMVPPRTIILLIGT